MASKAGQIERLLARNVEEIVERDHLAAALRSGKKLRVKLGIDPTGAKIHIGRAVVLWKLREFQDLGHQIVLIIGDYTALIGDPSDKLAKRPMLAEKDIKANLKTYLPQIGKILDMKKTEVRHNSEWLGKLSFRDVLDLAEIFTIQQMMERENFRERWANHKSISLRELTYPIMQGYDSVAVKADVELGGTDQTFNLLAGRKIQAHYGQNPQDVLITGMLVGTDGRKMSTTWGNVINIADAPQEQFGKTMALRDELIAEYFQCVTNVDEKAWKSELTKESPKLSKQRLAFEVVKLYHGEAAAKKAAKEWETLFSKKDMAAAELPPLKINTREDIRVLDIVMKTEVVSSKSEARRLISAGSVRVGDEVLKDPSAKLIIKEGETLKVGKRHFFRIAA